MKYLLLVIIFSISLSSIDSKRPSKSKKFIPISLNKNIYSKLTSGLATSSITGDKKNLDHNLKSKLKNYGLLHLLTPSGLHLSSILIWSSTSYFFAVLYFGIFIFLSKFNSYNSMERVLIFKMIHILQHKFHKLDIETIFILTLIIGFLIGHYENSPYSYLFSMLFWGTIIIFRKSTLKVCFFLNISLYFASSLTNESISPFSIIINPILTLIFSTYFPILFFSSVSGVNLLNKLNHLFLDYFIKLIDVTSNYDTLPSLKFSISSITVFYIFLAHKKYKIGFLVLCLSISPLNTASNNKGRNSAKIINLGHPKEIIGRSRGNIIFIDQSCKLLDLQIKCKKKPSNYGGPVF